MTEQKKFIVPNEEEKIIQIEIERLTTFKDHPFKVQEDEDMKMLMESIEKYGILNPLIVRPLKEGVYEIVSGHRRRYAAEKLGYRKVPVIIRVMRDEESVIAMVDANLQRESISFSEKAFAYKMKNDAMKRVRGRKKRGQIDDNLLGKRTIEIIAEESGESYKQIQRYIKVTALHPKLLEMLDKGEISFNPAVEISNLKMKEQENFIEAMDYAQSVPSLSQAQRIKALSKSGKLTLEKMQDILSEIKKGEITRVTFTNEQLHRYFPDNYTPQMMKREIIAILKIWMEERWTV
ncbi:MAG: ParB/RepB/Spo0J family partition protein [Schaedlerella sp.]|nr:ParB/RepB/Spo0J family partition protein [Schaedlerella sp.]